MCVRVRMLLQSPELRNYSIRISSHRDGCLVLADFDTDVIREILGLDIGGCWLGESVLILGFWLGVPILGFRCVGEGAPGEEAQSEYDQSSHD